MNSLLPEQETKRPSVDRASSLPATAPNGGFGLGLGLGVRLVGLVLAALGRRRPR